MSTSGPDEIRLQDEVPPRDEVLLQIEALRVEFPTREGMVKAVEGVDFEIKPRSTIGLVGESGSGKSVTAFAILQ
ncbi:MAG: hypothetical protein M3442_16340, partial [Chloroflexota bacterium]|nr:hypothetical protein [Chloroflexota bacterium]